MTFIDPEVPEKMVEISGKELKRLKTEAKEGKAALAENATLKRAEAFRAAGVDPNHPAAAYFTKGYEGDPDPEAVKAEWAKIAGTSTGQALQPDPTAEELAALQGAQDLVSGRGGTPPDKLAERDAKLAALSPNDPRLDEKFQTIMDEYGGRTGSLIG